MGRCFITQPALQPTGLVKSESESIKTDLGWWLLVVTVVNVDAYLILTFPDLTCHLQDVDFSHHVIYTPPQHLTWVALFDM